MSIEVLCVREKRDASSRRPSVPRPATLRAPTASRRCEPALAQHAVIISYSVQIYVNKQYCDLKFVDCLYVFSRC